jgi:hypothetical protein
MPQPAVASTPACGGCPARSRAAARGRARWGVNHGDGITTGVDLETFFATAPRFQPRAKRITGVVCGVRVEDVEDGTMGRMRFLDKLVDELARGTLSWLWRRPGI